ncbi:MAG: cytochrome c [Daejeonella sp.]
MRNRLLLFSFFISAALVVMQSCQNEQEINYQRYFVNGKGLYETNCQNCHSKDGSGLKGLYPPLTDTKFITSNRNKLACIIKYGMNAKIIVSGKEYQEQMPAKQELSDIDIAQIIVYVSNSFGNKNGFYDTSDANTDLKNCK